MNYKKSIGILSLVLGLAIFVTSLIFYILSFGAEDYQEYGAEFWADSDCLIYMIIGISISIYGFITLIKSEDSKFNFINATTFVLLFTGFVDSAYSYGKFFRAIAKGNGFDTYYFLFGLLGLAVLAFGIFLFLKNKPAKSSIKATA